MALVVVLHPLLRRLYDGLRQATPPPKASNGSAGSLSSSISVDARLRQRTSFDLYFALLFITVLHGFSTLKILVILYINFNIAMQLPKQAIPAATWLFNIGVLFANELAHGYRFAQIAETMLPFPMAIAWAKSLDLYGGLIPRWEILFNITVLRLIAFNLDYYWSLDRDRTGSPVEVCIYPLLKEELSFFLSSILSTISNTPKKKQLDPSSLSERDRVAMPAATSSFISFRTYLAYILYSPLYLAGPIITFNDYISQSRYPSPSITTRRTVLYGIRFLLTLLCMELLLHYIYVVAISQSSPDWSTYTPFQLSMLAFFNLHIIWLKLLLPWRFFRLWSLIDGIDPPENVVRCMSDNYSAFAFWRGWHRSFNRWVVRYIYVPLGGGTGGGVSKVRSIGNMLAVFTFVALWHDINLRLLMWGWLITLFVLPETLATMAFPAKKWRDRPNAYRVICGVGAVFNILMMMAANLVGFAVGLDGLRGLVQGIISSWQGLAFMLAACSALFVGVQVMFEVRESELRKGIKMKC
jgi:D-alanyl-lipoteichoic acid acyltransferase DltB (MBOAT superfamily)